MKRKVAIVSAFVLLFIYIAGSIAYAADPPSEGWFSFRLSDKSGVQASYKLSDYPIEKVTSLAKGAIKLTSASPTPTHNFRTLFVLSDRSTQSSDFQWYTYGGTTAKPKFTISKTKGYYHYAAMRLNTDEKKSYVDCVGAFTLDWSN